MTSINPHPHDKENERDMDPREIENPIAEEDFRYQAKMERFIKTCPETIYLCVGDDLGEHFKEHDEVTWCSDKVNDTDIVYTRKDVADQELLSLQDENKRLRYVLGNIITESYNSTAQLKEFEEYRDYWYEKAGLNPKEE